MLENEHRLVQTRVRSPRAAARIAEASHLAADQVARRRPRYDDRRPQQQAAATREKNLRQLALDHGVKSKSAQAVILASRMMRRHGPSAQAKKAAIDQREMNERARVRAEADQTRSPQRSVPARGSVRVQNFIDGVDDAAPKPRPTRKMARATGTEAPTGATGHLAGSDALLRGVLGREEQAAAIQSLTKKVMDKAGQSSPVPHKAVPKHLKNPKAAETTHKEAEDDKAALRHQAVRLIEDSAAQGLSQQNLLEALVNIRGDDDKLELLTVGSSTEPRSVRSLLGLDAVKEEPEEQDLGFYEDSSQKAFSLQQRMKPEVIAAVHSELEHQIRAAMGMLEQEDPAEEVDAEPAMPEAAENEVAPAPTTPDNIDDKVQQQQERRRRRLPETTSSTTSEELRSALQSMVEDPDKPVPQVPYQ